MEKVRLGVNVDHIATLREARKEGIPDLMAAAKEALSGGADGIVCHLREDRRHIQDADVYALRKLAKRLDFEMAATDEMVEIATNIKPEMVTIVPEKREELTTEGGLDVVTIFEDLKPKVAKLNAAGILVSLFIEPDPVVIRKSKETGAAYIEIHTGRYAIAKDPKPVLDKIIKACNLAEELGLRVNAGHGLDYQNTRAIAEIPQVEELNIGFSIIARSVFVGIKQAVKEMVDLLNA
ncbi:MAG: pyridoxine 5'-phosphate synthase [Candidatus Margulisbacteria bacterium]|nr:pyridoxine 5'-phosphate synthase [Candidatus Margulisiibacteriota bacterium]MBU1021630.1 pyridoxine 5'-phosphate synthase [Candidatus Margulisiibacteriota bacterium]MBU1728780.1 pyridoxine 5'-phosphate synthase [Candidatus Margulisiibacteriota bacterium]MBU1955746.1 pyridoxine 5'-phosphate synthase [Candidatus Margulisiibacteriota bacterium]